MSSTEKKILGVLAVILVAMVAAYLITGRGVGPYAGLTTAGADQPHGMGGQSVEELGQPGAAVEIVALVPVGVDCYVETVALLKEIQKKHADDIHLTVVNLMGPASIEWRQKLGVNCATIEINGAHSFELEGRQVLLQYNEGRTYKRSDLEPIIERELEKARAAS